MFIRYNAIAKIWEYDSTSLVNDPDARVGDGKAPWLPLPIDYSQIYNPPTIPPAYVLPATVAHKNIDNQFVAQTLAETSVIRGNNGIFYLVGLQGVADQHTWRFINYGDGFLRIEALNDVVSAVQGSIAIGRDGAIYERGRNFAMGAWQVFTPVLSGPINPTGGTNYAAYSLVGKTAIIQLGLDGFNSTYAGFNELYVTVPFTVANTARTGVAGNVNVGGVWGWAMVYTAPGENVIKIYANWAVGTSYVWATIPIQVG